MQALRDISPPPESPGDHHVALVSVYKRKVNEKDINPEIFVDLLKLRGCGGRKEKVKTTGKYFCE